MIRICERLSAAPESVASKPRTIVVFGAPEFIDLTGSDRTRAMFKEWFEIQMCSLVQDL